MRVALCANLETISSIWKEYIHDTKHKAVIIKDVDHLMDYIYDHKKTIVCVEEGWVEATLEELIQSIQKWYPKVSFFALSQNPNFEEGIALLELGVKGYGNAHMQPIHFLDAIKAIKKGNVWIYPEFIQKMIKNINSTKSEQSTKEKKLENLSKREREVAKLIHEGYTNQEIADITNITIRTVKAHSSSIYEKMGVKDRVAFVLYINETA